MKDFKSFFASKGVWGAAIAIAGALMPVFGFDFKATDGQELLSIVDELMTIGGSLFAMYGRVVAKKAIG